jgi:hypothetical protein
MEKDTFKKSIAKEEEPKTILKTETGNIDLTTILSLAFGGGITV